MIRNQKGEVNILMIMVVFFTFTTLALAGIAIYYIRGYQKAQTTVDIQKSAAAEAAKAQQKQADEAAFAEAAKQPYRAYSAPSVLGAMTLSFPKTWNIYAEENQGSGTQLNLFFNPEIVRADSTYDGTYALRVTFEQQLYTESTKKRQNDIEKGLLRVQPITVQGVEGTRYTGQVTKERQGIMVILPIRDKTLTLWTESADYTADFDSIIEQLQISP